MILAPLAALALAAAAQSPMPYSGEAPAASATPAASTAAVAVSTGIPDAVAVSTGGVKVAGVAKKRLARPIHAVIHPDAKGWTPIAVMAGGDPFRLETKATLRLAKLRGKYKGVASKAKAGALLHRTGDDRWIVVCIFPKALERRRMHFEVRLKIVEGFVDEVKAALIRVVDRRPGAGAGLDSYQLRAQGVAYEEDSPASGTLLIAALDPRPSKSALNSGTLKLAAFEDQDVGLADASWSVKGISF